ncbi:PREDICTED: F-box [Prunus dulcis]|nr:uncharacterized protein LOC117635062 [Prunus dulcis]VVA09687.1 PREDICTED: F-box [Prunus dulcis]
MTTDRLCNLSVVSSPAAVAVADQDSGMGILSLCDDLLCNILFRLSQKDLVKCKMVAKSWHQIISHVWLRRFWSQSPVLGLFFRTLHAPDDSCVKLSHAYLDLNYIYLDKPSELVSRERMLRLYENQTRDTSDRNLDCCNGLILLFNPHTYQFCVSNPITRQHVSIPKAFSHEHDYFCAALVFDPIESNHYRVVRIDYSQQQSCCYSTLTSNSTLTQTLVHIDIFSSQSGEWIRHGLQLDPMFIEGFKSSKFCSHFVYLRRAIYSLACSGKLLCIDLNTIKARAFELPHVSEDDDNHDVTMACLGVSMELVCYIKRDSSNVFRFWSYDDRCGSGDKWTLRYTLFGKGLEWRFPGDGTPVLRPHAISPSSHEFFFGTSEGILSYNFESRMLKFVHASLFKIAPPGSHFPSFTLRACLISLGERNAGSTQLPLDSSKGAKILSAEAPCQCDELNNSQIQMGFVGKDVIVRSQRGFTLPSEMKLCAAMELQEASPSPIFQFARIKSKIVSAEPVKLAPSRG